MLARVGELLITEQAPLKGSEAPSSPSSFRLLLVAFWKIIPF